MADGYDVDGVLPVDTFDRLDAGTNLGIVGPAMSAKRWLALRLLAVGYESDDGILCVTTESVARVLDDLEQHVDSLDHGRVGIIDCSGGGGRSMIEQMTESVSSPGDLTGISIGTAKLSRRFRARGISDIRYGIISVSTLLQYLDAGTVFKFLHIYASRVEETDGFGIYTLDQDAHDSRVVNTIRSRFDGVVELRETTDGDYECRVRGFGEKPSGWVPL